MGYLVKAGHVAIITEAATKGVIPDNQFEVAKNMVVSRFGASNVYFLIDKLVGGAVKQLQKVVEKAGNMLANVPGVSTVTDILNMFIGIALGYVDECCLGYVFYNKEDGAFKSSMDGVVIYFQNYKKLLKDAAITTFIVIGLSFGVWLAVYLVLGMLFSGGGIASVLVFFIALFVAVAVKGAFVDSWILVKMMTSYMDVAPTTQITFDLYGKLCGLSSKFRELFNKAKEETPTLNEVVVQQPVAATVGVGAGVTAGFGGLGAIGANIMNSMQQQPIQQQPVQQVPVQQPMQEQVIQQPQYVQEPIQQPVQQQPIQEQPVQQVSHARYCASCGSQLAESQKFCPNCGSAVQVSI